MKTIKKFFALVIFILSTHGGFAQETNFSFSVTEKSSDSVAARNGAELKLQDKFVKAVFDELSYKQLFSKSEILHPSNVDQIKKLIGKEITLQIKEDWNKNKCTLKGELNTDLEVLAKKIERQFVNPQEGKATITIQMDEPKVQSQKLDKQRDKPLTAEESMEAAQLFIKAMESQELGLNELALEYYQKGIEIESSNAEPYFNMGNAYYAIGKYNDAVKCYQKSIMLNNDYSNAYVNMGNAYLDIKDYPQAIIAYKKALEYMPDESMIYYNLGIAYFENKNQDLAISSLQKAAQLGSKEAQIYLSSNKISW